MPKIIGIYLGTTNSVAAVVEAFKNYFEKIKNLWGFLKHDIYSFYMLIKKYIKLYKNLILYNLSSILLEAFAKTYYFKNPVKLIYFKSLLAN